MSVIKDSYDNLRKKVKDGQINNIILGDSVDLFEIFGEDLGTLISVVIEQPIITFFESMGESNFFRFDIDRFDYGRFGDVGGIDEVVVTVL